MGAFMTGKAITEGNFRLWCADLEACSLLAFTVADYHSIGYDFEPGKGTYGRSNIADAGCIRIRAQAKVGEA
jgi:hypothetical protein